MSRDTDVSVVIVNFNAGSALAAALESLPGGLSGLTWDAVVVDNASQDGSEAATGRAGLPVRLVRMARNSGFASGVNAGVAATDAPLVLIMNPDCVLDAGSVGVLTGELASFPGCALVGPRILGEDGELQETARGDPRLLTGLFGRTGWLSRALPGLPVVRRNLVSQEATRSGASSTVVEWVAGTCMLARRSALEAVGGFDQRYFLYWEDADLCRRLRNAGWHIRYAPGAVARHQGGRSSRTVRRLAIREFHRSAYRYYITHEVPQRWHPGRAAAWLLLSSRAALKLLFSGGSGGSGG